MRQRRRHGTSSCDGTRSLPAILLLDEAAVEVGVFAAGGEQLFVGTAFDDMAVVEHYNLVGVADGAQAMGDHEAGSPGQHRRWDNPI
jgi:hypothetical protein